jgi:hypothetical protein
MESKRLKPGRCRRRVAGTEPGCAFFDVQLELVFAGIGRKFKVGPVKLHELVERFAIEPGKAAHKGFVKAMVNKLLPLLFQQPFLEAQGAAVFLKLK